MATVIFDFDSTLITCESLEVILSKKGLTREKMQKVKDITNQGMSGEITFHDSLQQRLSLANLSRQDFIEFGNLAYQFLTPGIKNLFSELKNQSIDVWILSGAVSEAIIPLGHVLGIPSERIIGVHLNWEADGRFHSIKHDNPINYSKWQAAEFLSPLWIRPTVAVGDGMTDYAIYEHHCVDYFIAWTQHVRREAIIEKHVPEAQTIGELRQLLKELIHG